MHPKKPILDVGRTVYTALPTNRGASLAVGASQKLAPQTRSVQVAATTVTTPQKRSTQLPTGPTTTTTTTTGPTRSTSTRSVPSTTSVTPTPKLTTTTRSVPSAQQSAPLSQKPAQFNDAKNWNPQATRGAVLPPPSATPATTTTSRSVPAPITQSSAVVTRPALQSRSAHTVTRNKVMASISDSGEYNDVPEPAPADELDDLDLVESRLKPTKWRKPMDYVKKIGMFMFILVIMYWITISYAGGRECGGKSDAQSACLSIILPKVRTRESQVTLALSIVLFIIGYGRFFPGLSKSFLAAGAVCYITSVYLALITPSWPQSNITGEGAHLMQPSKLGHTIQVGLYFSMVAWIIVYFSAKLM